MASPSGVLQAFAWEEEATLSRFKYGVSFLFLIG